MSGDKGGADEADVLNGRKWVRIMCDSAASGIWDIEGCACHPASLPVSGNVRAMLAGWQAWYEHDDFMEPNPFYDREAHAAFGRFIARMVKRELPDWTVIYYDETAPRNGGQAQVWRPGQPRDHFEYEITAEMAGFGHKGA